MAETFTLKLTYDGKWDLPFSEAIAAAVERGVVLPETYYGSLQGIARQLAFSVAGLASLEQLQQVKDSLDKAMQDGESFNSWQKRVVQSGILELPKHRLDNIFRTNLQGNYMSGKWEQFERNKDNRPYLMYDAINDSRVRPAHLAMDGVIRPIDDQFWKTHSPLNGFRCRCSLLSLSESQAMARSGVGKGLNKQAVLEDGVTPADPDKGWEYSPRERLSGVERAILNKQDKLSPVFKTTFNDMLKAWPGANIAKRISVNDISDLKPLLTEYARIYPEHLPHGVKAVLPADVTDDFFMATDGKGTFWFAEIEHKGFNSRLDLISGLAAIKQNTILSKNQEYAIESLWHEILHNRQKGISNLLKMDHDSPFRLLAETLNQYVSRLSYAGFIERLGGKASHQEWVMTNGYGYSDYVTRMQMIFSKTGVEERIKGDLFNINFNEDLMKVNALIADAVSKKSNVNRQLVSAALFAMIVDNVNFVRLLQQLDPN